MTTSVPSTGAAVTYQIDPAHSLVELSAKHMLFTTVKGRFTGVRGTIVAHDDPGSASVEAEIDAASLVTGDDRRDAHLRSADFLDVDKYPTITFKSTHIEGTPQHFTATGDLTVHGVTRQVVLDTELQGSGKNPYGKQVAGFASEIEINRKDFGLNWNVALESGGFLVSDRIKVSLEIQAVRDE